MVAGKQKRADQRALPPPFALASRSARPAPLVNGRYFVGVRLRPQSEAHPCRAPTDFADWRYIGVRAYAQSHRRLLEFPHVRLDTRIHIVLRDNRATDRRPVLGPESLECAPSLR